MKVVTIGRIREGNDVIINDPMVSRHHFQIVQDDDGSYRLSDFGSTNGTYINGRKVNGEVNLSEDDFVRVGNTTVPWMDYFAEGFVDTTPEEMDNMPESSVFVQTGEKKGGSGKKAGWIVGIVLSAILLFAGAVGLITGMAFGISRTLYFIFLSAAAMGALFLVLNIVMLAVSSGKKD